MLVNSLVDCKHPCHKLYIHVGFLKLISIWAYLAVLHMCYVHSCARTSVIYILLIVKPPIIVTVTISQNLDILQTAVLICNATGYDVSYYWTIGSGQFPSKVTGINSSTLIVPDLRSSDNNSYTCVVDNIGGSVYRTEELIVTGNYRTVSNG